MKIHFSALRLPTSGTLVLFADEGGSLFAEGRAVDEAVKGRLSAAIKAARFEGKRDSVVDVLSAGAGLDRVLIVGLGPDATVGEREIELIGGSLAGALHAAKVKAAAVMVELKATSKLKPEQAAALVASGAALRTYQFDRYKTKKADSFAGLSELTVLAATPARAKKAFEPLQAVQQGVHLARDLVNEPANVLFPVAFAKRVKELARFGISIEILTPAQMKKLGMAALLGVAQGSPHEARLVIMRWNGGKPGDRPVAFVGKGVTFDTGGVSIKPAAGMEDMKGDMGGAAAVTGLMLALAKRKAKANVVGAIGLVENAVDGNAQRPGDVVKSMSGQTIAVLNTDAEGRLVLADVLWYVQQRFKPRFMVNLATLTGAIIVALGHENAGLFSNNDDLAKRLYDAGQATGEKVWRMPLAPEYDKLIDHDVADVKNTGGRNAGSVTAAQFLQRFVNKVPWAHLDIAGTAMESLKTPINQSWASGFGVRLLNRLVADHYE